MGVPGLQPHCTPAATPPALALQGQGPSPQTPHAQDLDPTRVGPSQPSTPSPLACFGTRPPVSRGPQGAGGKEQRCAGSGPPQTRGKGAGKGARGVPRPGLRGGDPATAASLARHPSPRRALSAANASQQPPKKLVGLARCSETAFAPNGLYQRENKALEGFQSKAAMAAPRRGSRSPPAAPRG